MNTISYVKLSVALIGLFGMSLSAQEASRKAALKEKQAARRAEWGKKNPEGAALLINGHFSDVEKIKEGMQVRGDKINNVLQKTITLRESTDEFKRGIDELKSIPTSKKAGTKVLINVNQPSNEPTNPILPPNTTTIKPAHIAEPKQVIVIYEKEEQPESGCFDFFCCCNGCEKEYTIENRIH
jgi:hypothetical protein